MGGRGSGTQVWDEKAVSRGWRGNAGSTGTAQGGGHQQGWGTVTAAPSHRLQGAVGLGLPHPARASPTALAHCCNPGQGGQGLCSPPQPRGAATSWDWAEPTKTPLLNQRQQQALPAGTRAMGQPACTSHPCGAHPELPRLRPALKPACKNVFL